MLPRSLSRLCWLLSWISCSGFGASSLARAEELRFAGVLGNSGDSGEALVSFPGKPASGLGAVLDDENTLWDRGGSRQLNRYALDGRLLARFAIPESEDKNDQLALVDGLLVMKLRGAIFTLRVKAAPGETVAALPGAVEAISSSSLKGRLVIVTKEGLLWLDPVTGERTPLLHPEGRVVAVHVEADGTVYGIGEGVVRAWRSDGQPLPGFPKPFTGERPEKIGRHWFSHAWHGTINRMNEAFEPEPGVVLGGASGSFIGYLPQSGDLTNGRGMVHLRGDFWAVSGMGGVLQFLRWIDAEQRFEPVRRLGAFRDVMGLGLDAVGTIWTPRGAWRWNDGSDAPLSLGDKDPELIAQPVVLGGKTLCLLKKHYSYVQLGRGTLLDGNGWSSLHTPGIKDFELPADLTGAAAVEESGKLRLVFVGRGGKAWEMAINAEGQQLAPPQPASIPGLKDCTSLAWCEDRLVAVSGGSLVAYRRDGENRWTEDQRLGRHEGPLHLHSDGKRLVVSDAAKGSVDLYQGLTKKLGSRGGLVAPSHVAVSGDRIVVFEEGRQRLVRLEWGASAVKPSLTAKPGPSFQGETPGVNEADFQSLTRPGGVPVSVALAASPKGLTLSVATAEDASGRLEIGVANAESAYLLTGAQARKTGGRHHFRLPAGDWSQVRLALAVTLPDQRERFGFTDHEAIHAPFSADPSHWAPFDLAAYQEAANERRQEIRLAFDQPLQGKATLVIEDAEGRRVRNLVAGRSFEAGRQTVVWDGLDENGHLVPPGSYRWRGIAHPGIRPVYRMNFGNGGEDTTEPWGPNHSTLHHAVAGGDRIFFAAPVTEGGWALLALNAAGELVQGYEHQQGLGIMHNAIAVDDRYLYCAQDGFGWGGAKGVDLNSPSWKSEWTVTVVRFDIQSGKLVEWPDKKRFVEVDKMEVGPGSDHPDLEDFNLGGLAAHGGKLYVGCRSEKAVLVLDAATGKKLESIRLEGVRHLAAGDAGVFAATEGGVVRLSDGKLLAPADGMKLTGITVSPQGGLFVSDGLSHQVHRLDADGKRVETIGKPGGPYKGAYDPARMVRPAGLAVGPDGRLWVTEKRWNPKRVLAWDLAKKEVTYEKFGMPHYGGDGSGFDPEQPRRWIGLGCFWDVDIDRKTARPTHVLSLEEGHLGHFEPHSYIFFREGGRTFVSTRGKLALIAEVLEDGTLRDVAATANTHHFAYAFKWKPPQAYIDAFYEKWPEKRKDEKPGQKGDSKPWARRGMGVLWVDRNGDGAAQKEEFDFCGDQIGYADGPWGHLQHSLTLHIPVADKTRVKIAAIRPKGFLPNGVPDYPTLDEAIADATPVGLTPGNKRSGVATMRDSQGRFLFNSEPEMNAYTADGRHAWSYPNQWSDVHGSHDAPLPEPGVMQGVLAFLGRASLDEQSDVVFVNGNHGRCFFLTTDGLYLDEAFVDVRVSYLKNEYRLGGEIFGGSFGRGGDKYYVQIGHGPYRIYEVEGLRETRRMSGSLEVTTDQITAAERRNLRQVAAKHEARTVTLPGKVSWDKSGKFKTEVEVSADAAHLTLTYRVSDPSPWVNNGRDWAKLFATGDTVDLQFATDAGADPKRRSPVPGDKRLLIAPHEGKAIAVLYEHRKPGGGNPMEFTSPWRGEKVDNVQRLDAARIDVKTSQNGYEVKAVLPLADLGLELAPGSAVRADFGVTFGDAAGTDTNLRSYWSNQSTGLVDDIPGEIMLSPNLWGELRAAP